MELLPARFIDRRRREWRLELNYTLGKHIADVTGLDQDPQAIATATERLAAAAAVADWRPAKAGDAKIKKKPGQRPPAIDMVENCDILADVAGLSRSPFCVGFAAETGDDAQSGLAHARAKFQQKGCDVLVFNQVGGEIGFESTDNEVVIISAVGELAVPGASKLEIATTVWNVVIGAWSKG